MSKEQPMSDNQFIGALYTYPWDLVDEGLDTALDKIVDLTGCQEIQLTPSYHVSNYFLPHNPRRPVYLGENGAVYFSPDLSRYEGTRIKPRVSAEVADPEYFDRIVDAIGARGLTFSAWIVYLFSHHLSEKHPELAKHDAFGTPYVGQLSPAPRDVREYAVALTADIVERYRPEAVRVEALQRQAWDYAMLKDKFINDITPRCKFLLGLDFNPAARQIAESEGLDAEQFRQDVAAWLRPSLARLPTDEDSQPVTEQWLAEAFDGRLHRYLEIGRKNTTALWIAVADVIHASGSKVQSDMVADPERSSATDLDPSIYGSTDRATTGNPLRADDSKASVREIKDRLAPGGVVFSPLGPGNINDPAPFIERVHAARDAGIAGGTFYNYGLLREEQLGFIGQALRGR